MLPIGFSIRFDAPLDMRMNQDNKVSAKTINTYPEEELRRLFWEYGELRIAPALARTIVEARNRTSY